MTQVKKLRDKLYRKPVPNDMTIDEIEKLARAFGCKIKKGGNHQYSVVHIPSGTVIPIPYHGKCIKEAYIKELKDLFDRIEEGKR